MAIILGLNNNGETDLRSESVGVGGGGPHSPSDVLTSTAAQQPANHRNLSFRPTNQPITSQ